VLEIFKTSENHRKPWRSARLYVVLVSRCGRGQISLDFVAGANQHLIRRPLLRRCQERSYTTSSSECDGLNSLISPIYATSTIVNEHVTCSLHRPSIALVCRYGTLAKISIASYRGSSIYDNSQNQHTVVSRPRLPGAHGIECWSMHCGKTNQPST
jgi:hypothetical protein